MAPTLPALTVGSMGGGAGDGDGVVVLAGDAQPMNEITRADTHGAVISAIYHILCVSCTSAVGWLLGQRGRESETTCATLRVYTRGSQTRCEFVTRSEALGICEPSNRERAPIVATSGWHRTCWVVPYPMKKCSLFTMMITLVLTLGCSKAEKAPKDPTVAKASATSVAKASGATSAANAAPSEAATDAAMGQKLNAYIGCTNDFSQMVSRLRHNYLSHMKDPKAGPKPKQRRSYAGAWTMVDPKGRCADKIAKANAAKPSLPKLEAAGSAYADALLALAPLYKQASDYYRSKNFKDDKYKKGIALHPKLMAAWDAFLAADSQLRAITYRVNDDMQARALARIEKKHGRTLPFLTRNMLAQAKSLVRIGSVRDYPKLDLKPFTEQLTKYEASVKELRDYADAHKAEADKVMMLSNVISRSKNFLTASKELMRRKRDNNKYSTGERSMIRANNPRRVPGHPAKLVGEYNDLVDWSNRIRFQ